MVSILGIVIVNHLLHTHCVENGPIPDYDNVELVHSEGKEQ